MAATVIQQSDTLPVTHRPGLAVLGGASAVGIAASLLVPEGMLGFGFTLVVLLAWLASRQVAKASLVQPTRESQFLWIPILLFSALLAWRDAEELRFLNVAMGSLFVGILAVRSRPGLLSKGTVFDYPLRAFGAWAVAMLDALVLLANDISWRLIPQNAHGRHLGGALRGLLLATPLVIVFGTLFANADAGFEGMFRGIRLDGEAIVQQCVVGAGFAWMAAGFYRRIYIGKDYWPQSEAKTIKPGRIGGIELAIVLGSLNALFLLFVATQFRHFFGGLEVLKSTQGLGIADFARRGFFELVAVTGLTLPTLLGLHALIDPESAGMRRLYKVLATGLVALLAVVMISAAMKMKLYMDAYNLTTLRLYVAATLVWLAIVFGWFAFTVLRDREQRFAWGGVMALASAVLGLNLLSPDAFVARWNLAHSDSRAVDWDYLEGLSADAAPILQLAPTDRLERIRERHSSRRANADWRSLNLSLFLASQSQVRNR